MKYEDTQALKALDIPSLDDLNENCSNPGSYVIYAPYGWDWDQQATLYINRWVHAGSTEKSKLKIPKTPLQKVKVDFIKSPAGTAEAIKLASNVLQNLNPGVDRIPALFLRKPPLRVWVTQILMGDWGPDVDVPVTHLLYKH